MTETLLQRCSISELSTRHGSFAADVALYADRGWGGINVWLHKLETPAFASGYMPSAILPVEVLDDARAVIDAHGLAVPAAVVSGGFTNPELTRERIEHAIWAVGAAQRLGTETLVLVPGPRLGQSYQECLDLAARAIEQVLSTTSGTRLAIEPLRREQVDFINTLDEAMDLLDLVDDPRLGIQLDTWHLWRDPGFVDGVSRAANRIIGVDVCDASGREDDHMARLAPGTGVVPLELLLDAVIDTGYAGWFTLEIDPGDEPTSAYPALLATAEAGMIALLSRGG